MKMQKNRDTKTTQKNVLFIQLLQMYAAFCHGHGLAKTDAKVNCSECECLPLNGISNFTRNL